MAKKQCKDHAEGLKATCAEMDCKTPGACHGACGCLACDAHHVDKMKITWK
jgi:hypothetical protein